MKRILLFFFLLSFYSMSTVAQKVDTVKIDDQKLKKHSPRKATFMSLAVPGLGQAYNKKYWKIPLVYAAIGAPLYFAIDQQAQFNDFKNAYAARNDDDPSTVDNKYDGVFTDQNLLSLVDFHRKNRDLLYVLTAVAYALNVVDAAVDAHLYYFDISDDLSASFKPSVQYNYSNRLAVPSLTFSLKFTKKNKGITF